MRCAPHSARLNIEIVFHGLRNPIHNFGYWLLPTRHSFLQDSLIVSTAGNRFAYKACTRASEKGLFNFGCPTDFALNDRSDKSILPRGLPIPFPSPHKPDSGQAETATIAFGDLVIQ